MKFEEYLALLDWTGRQIRADKRGVIPADLAPILDRLQIRQEKWVESIQHFGRWFGRAVGTAAHVADAAQQHGRQWYQGVNRCAASFQ